MIFVTGTMRSGTSLWMQILVAAGFPHIGSAFPLKWGETLHEANPRGFYESALRWGVYYRTNPHPKSGLYLSPGATQEHLVKVFVPGLIRSDLAFVHKVVATMRPWREYVLSIRRLRELEVARTTAADGPRRPLSRRESLAPELTWFFDNYLLIRDLRLRRHDARLISYDRLLREPEPTIADVLGWLGRGDQDAACAAVEPGLRHQQGVELQSEVLSAEDQALCDVLYDTVDQGRPMSRALLEQLNQTWTTLRRRYPAIPEPDPWEGELRSPEG